MTTTKSKTSEPSRQDRRKQRTRTSLLEAARHLFASKGVDATTIAEIADQADVGVGSFYNHFETKDEILENLLGEALAEQLVLLKSRQSQVEDVAEKISVAHRHLVRLAQRDPEWGRLLTRLDIEHRVVIRALGPAAQRDLRDGIKAGRFEVSSPELALHASGGALMAVIHAVLEGDLGTEPDVAHAEGVLRSLGLDAGEAAEIARRPLPEPGAG